MKKESLKDLLPNINPPFDKVDLKDEYGEYIIPDIIFSKKDKVRYLPPKWDARSIHNIESQMTIYTDLPILCKGSSCIYSSTCPLVKARTVDRFLGKECPIEIVEAFKHFRGYIFDLDINPEDYTDIQILNDLIACHIVLNRITKQLKTQEMVGKIVSGVDIKTSLTHNQAGINVLFNLQKQMRASIQEDYKLLLASRQAKLQAQAKVEQKTNLANAISDIMSRNLEPVQEKPANYIELSNT